MRGCLKEGSALFQGGIIEREVVLLLHLGHEHVLVNPDAGIALIAAAMNHAEEAMVAIIRAKPRAIPTKKAIRPLRAQFIHARPVAPVEYTQYLGCPVKFQANWDALFYAPEVMALKVEGASPKLLHVLENACRRILGSVPKREDIVHSVRKLIIDQLQEGSPHLDDVTSELSISSKTLERRLTERNTTFSKLLDDIRCEFARSYLAETDARLDQITFAIRFTDPATFVRAFKRWTGMTPMQFREMRRNQGP